MCYVQIIYRQVIILRLTHLFDAITISKYIFIFWPTVCIVQEWFLYSPFVSKKFSDDYMDIEEPVQRKRLIDFSLPETPMKVETQIKDR